MTHHAAPFAAGRRDSIDFQAVAGLADLQSLIEADLGPPGRGRKWACCFHDDHNPSLGITPDGKRFRCWSARCGATGTALDWLMRRDGLSLVEAARAIDPSLLPAGEPRPARRSRPARPLKVDPRPAPKLAPTDRAWQAATADLIAEGIETLWSPAGRQARAWLKARGLSDATVRRFSLGFSPGWRQSAPLDALNQGRGAGPEPIKVAPGILLPWAAPTIEDADTGGWSGCNVRRLAADPFESLPPSIGKCQAFAGSEPGHGYPDPEFLPSQLGPPLLITEGEWDALLAWQIVGDVANVATPGSASNVSRLKPSFREILASHNLWLIATDHDAAGDRAAQAFMELAPRKCRRLRLPKAGDIGEFIQRGGDLRAWLHREMGRLGVERIGFVEGRKTSVEWAPVAKSLSTSRLADPDDLAERGEILHAEDVAPPDFDPWPIVASWPLEAQREWSSLAAHFYRESRTDGHPLTGRLAELAAFESMTAGADRPD